MPKIVVLDEPTIGLDPQGKYLVWQKLTELKSQGITQLLCTQNMEEANVLCDRVAIMNQGKILSLDFPEALISRYVGDEVWEVRVSGEERDNLMKGLRKQGRDFEEVGGNVNIFHVDKEEELIGLLNNQRKFKRRSATLEDVFLRLTGRSLLE